MGIDINIYWQSTDGELPNEMYTGYSGLGDIKPYTGDSTSGATHQIDSLCRYYGTDYARGNWPLISAVLMSLFASTNVAAVWYCGDGYPDEDAPITIDDVLKISRFYMENGKRPYRNIFISGAT